MIEAVSPGDPPDPALPRLEVGTRVAFADVPRANAELFAMIERGALGVTISKTFPLDRGAEAHELLESRTSTGKVLLIP